MALSPCCLPAPREPLSAVPPLCPGGGGILGLGLLLSLLQAQFGGFVCVLTSPQRLGVISCSAPQAGDTLLSLQPGVFSCERSARAGFVCFLEEVRTWPGSHL